MPVESATYISDLNVANPTHTDGINQADSHMRLIKTVLKTSFTAITGAVTATHTALNAAGAALSIPGYMNVPANGSAGGRLQILGPAGAGASMQFNQSTSGQAGQWSLWSNNAANTVATNVLSVDAGGNLNAIGYINGTVVRQNGNPLLPAGCILEWSGSAASIPAGWHLCDGTNGTPDLRNRFTVCAGATYAVAQVGGAVSAAVVTDTQGTHSHSGATVASAALGMSGGVTNDGAHSHGGVTGSHQLTAAEIPNHDHGVNGFSLITDGGSAGGLQTGSYPLGVTVGHAVGSDQGHTHTISGDGTHGHTVTVSNVPAHTHGIYGDGSHAHNVTVATLPPFYALCKIMKL